MNWKWLLGLLLVSVFFTGFAQIPGGVDPLREFEARAAKFKSRIRLPQFESSTNEIRVSLRALLVLLVWHAVPETKGQSLEEIERSWSDKP
jgi:hypothetical protein